MKFILIVFFGLLFSTSYSQSIIRLTNNTDSDVYAAFTYWDSSNKSWNSAGWTKVSKYSTLDRDFGNYKGKVYIHGHKGATFWKGASSWGRGWQFCVDKENKFLIKGVDKISNCKDKANFSELNIARGVTTWTFNP